jgi:hypothetical protein
MKRLRQLDVHQRRPDATTTPIASPTASSGMMRRQVMLRSRSYTSVTEASASANGPSRGCTFLSSPPRKWGCRLSFLPPTRGSGIVLRPSSIPRFPGNDEFRMFAAVTWGALK